MKIASKLLCLIWAITLLVMLNVAFSVGASGMSISPIAYGEQLQVRIAYDGVSSSTIGYDSSYAYAANEKENRTTGTTGPFAVFAGFLAAKTTPHFSGTAKPWTKGATPDSIYTHIDPKTGKAVQNAVYDSQGNVIGHVDFKNHGPGAASGHGHTFPQPGNPASGHGPGNPHIPNNQLPPGWDALPPGVPPRTPIGQ